MKQYPVISPQSNNTWISDRWWSLKELPFARCENINASFDLRQLYSPHTPSSTMLADLNMSIALPRSIPSTLMDTEIGEPSSEGKSEHLEGIRGGLEQERSVYDKQLLNRIHGLSNTGRALYPRSYENSWRARWFDWVQMWTVAAMSL